MQIFLPVYITGPAIKWQKILLCKGPTDFFSSYFYTWRRKRVSSSKYCRCCQPETMCKAHIISHVCCSEYNTHVQSEWKSFCTSLNMDTGKSEKKIWMYTVRQFNSRNGPVKTKFAYLCTSGCCRLQNTLLVKLRTLWDDGTTAVNSLENRFPEYLAVMLSRCVGCQKVQQIFVPSGHFFNFGKSQKSQGAKSGE